MRPLPPSAFCLERKGEGLRVIIEDNGQGFDPAEALADSAAVGNGSAAAGGGSLPRLGLSGIRERLALIGGTLSIESARGVGTTLYIQIPVAPAEPRPIP